MSSDLLCLLIDRSARPLLTPKAGLEGAWDLKPRDVEAGACGEPLPPGPKAATCAQLRQL